MIEQEIEIHMPEGTSDGMMYRSQDRRRLPGVIFLTDIGGIRPSQREMAQRLAAEGYTVLLPNVFYRAGRPPLIDFPVKIGEERTMKRIGELSGPLTPEAVERDASAYVDFLSDHESVADGPMGVVGYCFSGALAMRIAAARPDRIAAAASFHGGRLFTDAPTSPHLLLPRIKAQLYFGHAIQDQSMPQESIANLNRALQAWGGQYKGEIYDGAYHGWTVPDSPVYNRLQAEQAFEKLKESFGRALGERG
jgi:carboxymethylenebutenolidase